MTDARLTRRQIEVLKLLATGMSARQIGDRLQIRPRTVYSHSAAIYFRLDVHSQPQATLCAVRMGLLDPRVVAEV